MDELTIAEAAALLGCDDSTIRQAVARARIPARRIGRRVLVVRRDDVLAYALTRHAGPPRGRRHVTTAGPTAPTG